ncbi:hypothetical protein NNO07_27765, partial [Pseudomonas resinovorans]
MIASVEQSVRQGLRCSTFLLLPLSASVQAAVLESSPTQEVMGRPPVASALTFKNVTEPGKGLAQG